MKRARLIVAGGGALLVALSIPWTPAFSSGSAGRSCVRQTQFGDTGPAWSPNGKEIAFSRSGRIVVWNLRTRKLRTIEGGSDPVWSPDGKRLLFTREVMSPAPGIAEICRGVDDLFRAPANGLAAAIAVTNTEDVSEAAPTWSASSGIAYDFFGPSIGRGLAVLNPAGGDPRVIWSVTGGVPEQPFFVTPSWSPNGRKLAFAAIGGWADGSGVGIYTANADGSEGTQIVDGDALEPAWSPDGVRIAFTRGREKSESSIFVVRIDGTRKGFIAEGFQPAWSPDGRRLVFVRERAYPAQDSCWVDNLFVVTLKGKKPKATPLVPRRLRVTPRACH